MEIGKIPNNVLKEIVLDKIKGKREEIIVRPKVGEDCCAVDFGDNVCVLSSDPITGAENEVGRLAVHISCNDVASCGAEPIGLLVTILVPPRATKKDLELVMSQISDTANSLNVDIMGGHTEVTGAVNRFVIITTAVGNVLKDKLVTTSGAKVGDDIIITKYAGIEGTAIIAHDKERELANKVEKSVLEKSKALINDISVVKEGMIAGRFGVNSMHDITEGGVLGAVWEVTEASGKGAIVYNDRIPILKETLKLCQFYNIDPLRLISSGCMIITCKDGNKLVNEMENNGIKATIIGKITNSTEKHLVLKDGYVDIGEPVSDELYKVID
ncbi:MAG: AIR synthase [Clostridiaceae bacterium]|jgi:hydrogenase maturation factor|nr:AIR synthase [Clostridiaceae bacterium]